MNKVRCVIYTRKSSEEGVEQDFNSLDAQREACTAYIQSQASEGWSLIGDSYDDGGLSGGTMKHPALQPLLKDIRDGRIDIVVVYKVDRLTRSLLDFAKLVETMDKAGVSFVSVTQSFNTTNSMGRLTLNMLLSFAPFEREVTAERIRDKIAASKAKGMWMGGIPPLGYEPDGRSLAIVEEHAAIIRYIFEQYRKVGNVRLVFEQLREGGVGAPQRTLSTGSVIGGKLFSRGQLYRILFNPVYVGEIHHNGKVYRGRHEPIIQRELWTSVQARLGENRQGEQRAATIASPSLLAGKVFDENNEPLVASHACKGKVRYRYYVSKALQHGGGTATNGWRMPATELEGVVKERLCDAFTRPLELLERLGVSVDAALLPTVVLRASEVAKTVRSTRRGSVGKLVHRVDVRRTGLTVALDGRSVLKQLDIDDVEPTQTCTIDIEASLSRSGRALKLIQSDGKAAAAAVDQTLVELVVRSRAWLEEMTSARMSMAELARAKGINPSFVSRTVRLAFLSPKIVSAILSGRQPANLTAQVLRTTELPVRWSDQHELLGL